MVILFPGFFPRSITVIPYVILFSENWWISIIVMTPAMLFPEIIYKSIAIMPSVIL